MTELRAQAASCQDLPTIQISAGTLVALRRPVRRDEASCAELRRKERAAIVDERGRSRFLDEVDLERVADLERDLEPRSGSGRR